MKKYVLIFCKTKYQKTPYDKWLEGTGITPIILTSEDLAEDYSHFHQVYAFRNYDHNRLVEKAALQLASDYNVIGVFARAEADVIRAAQLREIMRIPGQKNNSSLAFRDKVVMKNHLNSSEIKLPQFSPVHSGYDIINFIKKYDFPVVIKPRSESGSLGTCIVQSEKDLNEYLPSHNSKDLMIEKYVEGSMFHVDGLILNGKIAFIHPSQYINDCLSFRNNDFLGTVTLDFSHSLYRPLVEATKTVLGHLPLPTHMAFHAELWVKNNGDIVFCEIASRTGGGLISSVVKHCFGFDIDQEWFYAECGLTRDLTIKEYKSGGAVWFPPENGTLVKLPLSEKPEWILEQNYNGIPGQNFRGGVKSGLFLSGYVVQGLSEEDVRLNIQKTVGWYHAETKWEDIK